MDKEQLSNLLKEGRTTREIATIFNISSKKVSYWIQKYELQYLYKYPKNDTIRIKKIETKEQAYILGFIIADGYINHDDIEISVAIQDIELIQFISSYLQCKYRVDNTKNKKQKRFSRVRLHRRIKGLSKFIGGTLKKDRNVPFLNDTLEVYLVRGIFDADGCITWGRRKDRNRIWQRVSFTSSLNILIPIQKILYKNKIASTIRPKVGSNCFVLEFSNKEDVLSFYDYLYADKSFIPLKRKFDKYEALRLELGEIGENIISNYNTIPSRADDLSSECVETTGELNGVLNNQTSTQGL